MEHLLGILWMHAYNVRCLLHRFGMSWWFSFGKSGHVYMVGLAITCSLRIYYSFASVVPPISQFATLCTTTRIPVISLL
jgi:hypothetical protein